MTNKLNLTPIDRYKNKSLTSIKEIDNDRMSIPRMTYKVDSIHKQSESMKEYHRINYDLPIYERTWTMSQVEKILKRWYSLDVNVNDLMVDDMKLLQSFYRRFKLLKPEEQRVLVKVYHPYCSQNITDQVTKIKRKLMMMC
ncbi:hypothetical protein EFJ78_08800 [Pediococcus pentosaceus]|uniref:hypothetical protein n=1 Tax=Pediococcus pentosaceus TaxID=1255 RepID=UPI00223B2CA3|nr:hypothetical protein [Pediococcus pentosaceus]MCS8563917.1 hypothetical protein [Pediococcus pentosaceus]MCS8568212.1 hypothetical protein [Pediococcus pentosaceus]MCS8580854.1 hypothetical protein [Pediococcus pentosaceus]